MATTSYREQIGRAGINTGDAYFAFAYVPSLFLRASFCAMLSKTVPSPGFDRGPISVANKA